MIYSFIDIERIKNLRHEQQLAKEKFLKKLNPLVF